MVLRVLPHGAIIAYDTTNPFRFDRNIRASSGVFAIKSAIAEIFLSRLPIIVHYTLAAGISHYTCLRKLQVSLRERGPGSLAFRPRGHALVGRSEIGQSLEPGRIPQCCEPHQVRDLVSNHIPHSPLLL